MADYDWDWDSRNRYSCCGEVIPKHRTDCIYIRGFERNYSDRSPHCRGCGCFVAILSKHEQEGVCQPLQDLLREERHNRERNTIQK